MYYLSAYEKGKVLVYIRYYIEILRVLVFQPERLGLLVYTDPTGWYRPYPFINALATGFILGIYLMGIYLVLSRKVHYPPIILAFGVLGMMLVSIGFVKHYIVPEIPSSSVARYVVVYGFFYLVIFNIYTLYHIITKKYFNRLICYIVLIIAFLGIVGASNDPITFPYRPSISDVEFSKSIASMLSPSCVMYFRTLKDQYYLGPQISFWRRMINSFTMDLLVHHTTLYDIGGGNGNILFSTGIHTVYYQGLGIETILTTRS